MLFGSSPGGLVGLRVADLLPPGLPRAADAPGILERTGLRMDGSEIALELTLGPSGSGDGTVCAVRAVGAARRAGESDRRRQQAVTAEIGRLALADPDPAVLLDTAVELIRDVLGADMVAVMDVAPDGQATVHTGSGVEAFGSTLDIEGTVAELALARRAPVITDDALRDPRFTARHFADQGIRSVLAAPLLVGDSAVGALSVASRTPGIFRPAHIDFIEGVGSMLAVAAARRRASGALAESRARLRAIVENTPAAVYMTDLAGRFSLANRTAEAMMGVEPGTLVGRSAADVMPLEVAERSAATDTEVLRAGRAVSIEQTVALPTGEQRVYTAVKFPVLDAHGELMGVGVVAMDVTDRKRDEAEREALTSRLRQAARMESFGQLAGGIAHDFNNLLAVIMNFASFVQTEVPAGSAAADDVEQILEASGRAAELTRRLLLFSRSRTGEVSAVDLVAVIGGLRQILRRALGEHIDLRIRCGEGLWPVTADPSQVEQVLVNLAVNARDAMPDGGTLSIELDNVELDERFARSLGDPSLAGRFVRLTVADTGAGMTAHTIEHAFEPFFTTKPGELGTGLGLATVYGIVTGAGGHVAIESELGAGTTIRVHLPMADRVPDAAPPAGEPRTLDAGTGERILLVGDDARVCATADRVLRRAGYAVTRATDAADALRRAATDEPYALVLTDAPAPGTDGGDLAEHLAELGDPPTVLFLSGDAAELLVAVRRELAREGGMGRVAPGDPATRRS